MLERMQCNCDANSQGNIAMTDTAGESGATAHAHGRDHDVDFVNADASDSNGRVFMRGLIMTCPCAIKRLSELQEHVHMYTRIVVSILKLMFHVFLCACAYMRRCMFMIMHAIHCMYVARTCTILCMRRSNRMPQHALRKLQI